MTIERLRSLLHAPTASDDKYSRGVVGFVTGSEKYPGAALLGIQAAARTGVGMIRYAGPGEVSDLVLQSWPEVVLGQGRCDSYVFGSGIDATATEQLERIDALAGATEPKVFDAGALAGRDWSSVPEMSAVLTPHAGELARLLDEFGKHFELDYEAVQAAAAITGQVVLLKGNTTLIADPHSDVRAVAGNSTALATAGTGDVLAGILGALLAGGVKHGDLETYSLSDFAELAVLLHSEAAFEAAQAGPIVAHDVAAAIQKVVRRWLTD